MHELVTEHCVQGVDWVTETDQSQKKLSWHSLQGLAIQSFYLLLSLKSSKRSISKILSLFLVTLLVMLKLMCKKKKKKHQFFNGCIILSGSICILYIAAIAEIAQFRKKFLNNHFHIYVHLLVLLFQFIPLSCADLSNISLLRESFKIHL